MPGRSTTEEYKREYREKHREKARAYAREYRRKNKEKRKESQRRYYHEVTKPKKISPLLRRLKEHGLMLEQYQTLLIEQDMRCGICGFRQPAKIEHQYQTLQIDHDHSNGKVRGLLCHQCNTGIGMLRDSKELMEKAVVWLEVEGNLGTGRLAYLTGRVRK